MPTAGRFHPRMVVTSNQVLGTGGLADHAAHCSDRGVKDVGPKKALAQPVAVHLVKRWGGKRALEKPENGRPEFGTTVGDVDFRKPHEIVETAKRHPSPH